MLNYIMLLNSSDTRGHALLTRPEGLPYTEKSVGGLSKHSKSATLVHCILKKTGWGCGVHAAQRNEPPYLLPYQ